MSGYRFRHSGNPISGTPRLPGSKHELAHALAVGGMQPSGVLSNVADTDDTAALLDCLRLAFERVTLAQNVLSFSHPAPPAHIHLPLSLTSRSRNIYCLLPALLKWAQDITMDGTPTGCPFEYRPNEWYFEILKASGVQIRELEQGTIHMRWVTHRPMRFTLSYPSVTATIIALAMGTQEKSETVIRGASREPSVLSAVQLANELGHTVDLQGRNLRVIGHTTDKEISTTLGPDIEVAATYLSGLLMAGGTLRLDRRALVDGERLHTLFQSLGVAFTDDNDAVEATYDPGSPIRPLHRDFGPAPMAPSDWAPMLAMAFITHSRGASCLVDTLFSDRFEYLQTSPARMRWAFKLTQINIDGRNCAHLNITSPLDRRLVKDAKYAPRDLRAAAASVLSCLRSNGWVQLTDDSQLRRGYENLIPDLGALTALDVEPVT